MDSRHIEPGKAARSEAQQWNLRPVPMGEETAAERLERRLAGTGVLFLHHRHDRSGGGNIDHICVAPAGAIVIDAKRWEGRARVRDGRLVIAGRDRTEYIDVVLAQVELVRGALRAMDLPDVPVHGAVCWVETDGLPLIRRLEVSGILVDGTRGIEKRLLRGEALAPQRVTAVAEALDAAFPPV
jgi:hypothetical protein